MNKYLVIDVESIGLHGEGYAVAGVFVETDGSISKEFCLACPPDRAEGFANSRKWVADNIPPITVTAITPESLRQQFWMRWDEAKKEGYLLAAECAWPVEARFLIDCIRDNLLIREWAGPYPLHDIASFMEAAGMDPMEKKDRLPDELPVHDPLADVKQSARLLIEALSKK